MTAAHDYEEMHHLVDRLPPAGVRRLRLLVESDPELAKFAGASGSEHSESTRNLSFIGLGASGRSDVSERHDELLREELDRPS
ncbi:hypothetical protein ACFOWE_21460 [Planomonospora corallina]|uniref:Uncharacterized protein n=1 Tax=Planomonospora corallina TaxID=1806052 RepID=A0ABV8ID47_9ACTN